ncbi:MAG: hypothetical protein M3Q70_03525 [bacterium]|nr:hypothetical protein [bacterium]
MKTIKIEIPAKILIITSSVFLFIALPLAQVANPQKVRAVTQTIPASTTWTAPAEAYYVTVESWGAGGGGWSATSGVGGGGGGAYSVSTLRLIPGNNYTVTVGTGGTPGNPGGDTTFVGPTSVIAKGGSTGTLTTGGSGGLAATGTGTTKFSGGTGGSKSTGNGRGGGGGGGSATTTAGGGDGGTGSSNTGGVAGVGQGNGGAGGNNGAVGGNGVVPGGGGGGGGNGAASGTGASGQVVVTYTPAVISVVVSDATVNYGILAPGISRSTLSSQLNDTQVASNDGNFAEDFNIRGNNSAAWALSVTAGNNQYVHSYCTTGSGSPDPCDTAGVFTSLTTSYQPLATYIAVNGIQRFDLRVTSPTTTTATANQSVDVTIQAVVN